MFTCSERSNLTDDTALGQRRQNGRLRLSKVARSWCRSTEDLCKSTNLYRSWDQWQMIKNWRHAAWALLRDNNVLCAVWLDEVLAFHGAELLLGDYCLVVHNVQVAAGILASYGYRSTGWTGSCGVIGGLRCQRIRMSVPGAKVDVVLLSAQEWCYDLSHDALHDELCPYLPEFIDAIVGLWLKVPTRSYVANMHLMQFLESIIDRCYGLNDFGDNVCENDYAIWLKPYHREVHFDIVARSNSLTKTNLDIQSRHRYHVHKAKMIRQGRYAPKPRKRRVFNPQLPTLAETPEDTRPVIKGSRDTCVLSTPSTRIFSEYLAFPDYMEIGVAL